jgi:hypothetical protein
VKNKIILLLVLVVSFPVESGIRDRLAKIGAALGIVNSRKIPKRFKPSQALLYPHILFHGSPYQDLTLITPHRLDTRGHGHPIIFASHHIAMASLFMLKHKGKFACGRLSGGDIFYMTNDKRRCILEDQGGAIYLLSSDSFFCEPYESLGLDEWISYGSIKPLLKFIFPSALDAMLSMGVKIYFVDDSTYARYWRTGTSDAEWTAFFKPLRHLTQEQLDRERLELKVLAR